ncbi:MAG: ABC transporter permease [Chloroflexota bacterium]|nr:ABC transporter permease [Chloroflexota bacterium]
MFTSTHLAIKEVWRNRGRFLLFSLVVALITVLILFVAALGEGLGSGNREYIEKLDADLIVYQDTARLSIASSRVGCEKRRALRNVEGVREVGPIGFSSASVVANDRTDLLDVSFIGVEPGKPGEPPVIAGVGLLRKNTDEAIVDRTVALVADLQVGDSFTIRSPQGNEDEFYTLEVVGISDSRKYGIRPSIFAPIVTWDRLRPQAVPGGSSDTPDCNVVAVQLDDPAQLDVMRQRLHAEVDRIEAVDLKTAYENTPGYTEQQSTLNTQNGFALLIGVLVIGGFFQIQTLQKVPQIGMLKAIGTPNGIVALAVMIQILVVTLSGVVMGSLATLGIASVFPPNIPIIFELGSGAMAVASIVLMSLVGGLVSIRYSLRVEPLIALGLG